MSEHLTSTEDQRPTLLLVDDEEAILKSLQRTLRRSGYQVVLALGGEEALRILAQTTIHAIICDQRMPGVAGPEVLAKAFELQPDAYRITLTGYTDLEAAQKSINEGRVNQFMMKPWDDEHLRRCVADGLAHRNLVVVNRRLQELTQQQNLELQSWNDKLEVTVKKRTEQLRTRHEQLVKFHKALEGTLRDTVDVLVSSLEMFNPALGVHSKRVMMLAQRLGHWLGLDEAELRDLGFAAHLHDLGKIATLSPAAQVARRAKRAVGQAKPASREPAEAGYHMLRKVTGFSKIAAAVRHQTERYDGRGKPNGMAGENIPMLSRIIAVADAYDAAVFSSNDPTQMDREAGRKALELKAGRELDPRIVELFLEQLRPVDDNTVDTPVEQVVELSPRQVAVGMRLADDLCNDEGVLLIKADTVLSQEMVERLHTMSKYELEGESVRVKTAAPPTGNAAA